jgi:hypothetical protein
MTIPHNVTPTPLDRWSGGCWMGAGLLLLIQVLHPDVSETTFAAAAVETPLWVTMHAAAVLAAMLSLVGLVGLYARHAERLGWLGAVGFAATVVGLVLAASIAYAEAFLLPAIAADAPALFAWDGPVVANRAVQVTSAMALLWLVGLVLLGLALLRSGTVPRLAGLALAVTAMAWLVFAGPFVAVLGPLSTVAFAASHVLIGASLWSGANAATGLSGLRHLRRRGVASHV